MVDQSQCDLISAAVEGIGLPGSPYFVAFRACIAFSLLVFVVSTVSKNYSQTDKLWSITPFLYAWMAVVDQRTLFMAIVSTVWGFRLTWNFHRRGGYKWPIWDGEEDYRWAHIQQGNYIEALKEPIPWMMFNLTFISFYQHILLLLIVAPSFVAATVATDPNCSDIHAANPLNFFGWDGLATVMMLTFIVLEAIADNQQYNFQSEKYRQINAGEERKGEYEDGFCQSGLFAILRKPNYASEQMIWVSFYIYSIAATGAFWNWSVFGCILLIMLVHMSGQFTEKLTLMKYPEKYARYQQRVGLYFPKLRLSKNITKKKSSCS